jgi:hypothetical protein
VALTTAVEIELKTANFIEGYEKKKAVWLAMAKEAYAYSKKTLGEGHSPKPDDVAGHLALALEVRDEFVLLKSQKGARAHKWFRYFADLVLDRTWKDLS